MKQEQNHLKTFAVQIVNESDQPLPFYATEGSSGMDLYAHIAGEIELKSLERKLIPTGLKIALPAGLEAQVRPRSGLAVKKGITVLNSPGTIDSDYRGELKVILINLSSETAVIKPGERIAQLVVAPFARIEWELSNELSSTDRGEGGFGSTGVK